MKLCDFVDERVKPVDGKMILIGGRPAMGKTTFIINMMDSLAKKGQKFLYFDLEGDGKRLVEQKSISNVTVVVGGENGSDVDFIKKTCNEINDIAEHIVVIDYLQIIDRNDGGVLNIQKALRGLVEELGITLVITAHLSRETEKRNDKRPRVSDLSVNSISEKLFSEIWLLYREAYYDAEADATTIDVITTDDIYEFSWNGKDRKVE